MREVPALVQAHREDRVAGLEECFVDRDVGVRTTVGLDVRVIGAEEGGEATTCEVFDLVDDVVPPVVPPSRVALGVLVGQYRTGRRQHGG